MTRAGSLERAVAARGVAVVVATLALLGVATAVLLHVRDGAALDRALIVAAHGGAASEGWEMDHAPPPIDTRLVADQGTAAPRELVERALRSERPVFFDVGDRRGVLLVVEREDDDDEEHRLVEATARRPGWMVTTGPFLAIYLPLAAAAAGGSGLLLRFLVRRAMAPLARARREAAAITSPTASPRLTEDGPEEVAALVGAINGLLDRLGQAYAAQARFTAEAAHELRTPVTAMSLGLDLALRHPRDAEAYREALVSVREEVDRLQRLVQGLVVLARLDGGTEVDPQLRAVRELVAEAVAAERAEIRAELGDERAVVHPDLVSIALRNLLRNAARHAPGTPITVRSRKVGEQVRIEVEDRGGGVPEADRERLFDRMARSGEARRRDPEGLGLGLPLAREIARREGGDCTLEAGEAGGCRAVLTLRSA